MKVTNLFKGLAIATTVTALSISGATVASAATDLPGKGVTVIPGQDNLDGENFQTILVMKALKKLGYDVQKPKFAKYPALHLSLASGDVTFMADHWSPFHDAFYAKAGGDEKLSRVGGYIPNCAQGYLIDKKTADKYEITNLGQLKDPKIAKLFDGNDDGKADLVGCVPGWSCERTIEHQLDAYELRDTVSHNQGEYSAIIADAIARYKDGASILYYSWTPYWVSGVLVPGKDVVWLQVPFDADPSGKSSKLPNGRNYGFAVATQKIVANKDFVEANPAAAKLFELMQVSPNDISAQNLLMKEKGQGSWAAAEQHADNWIKHNQKLFDGWVAQAIAAAN